LPPAALSRPPGRALELIRREDRDRARSRGGLAYNRASRIGHLRDLLLPGFDEGAKMLDRPPRVLGRDARVNSGQRSRS
jgi:hypothetical protein